MTYRKVLFGLFIGAFAVALAFGFHEDGINAVGHYMVGLFYGFYLRYWMKD